MSKIFIKLKKEVSKIHDTFIFIAPARICFFFAFSRETGNLIFFAFNTFKIKPQFRKYSAEIIILSLKVFEIFFIVELVQMGRLDFFKGIIFCVYECENFEHLHRANSLVCQLSFIHFFSEQRPLGTGRIRNQILPRRGNQ